MKPLKNTTLYSRLALITSVTLVVGYFVVYAAWSGILDSEIAPSAVVTSALMTKIKNNLDYLSGGLANFGFSAGNVGIGTTTPQSKLQIGNDINVGNLETNLLKLWRASQMENDGTYVHPSDGGSVSYTWDNGQIRVDTSVGSHHWQTGYAYLPIGKYILKLQYRPSPTVHGWSVYGSNSNGHSTSIKADGATYLSADIVSVTAPQINKNLGYSITYTSPVFSITTAGRYSIWQMTQPYGSGGYKYYLLGEDIIRVE